MLSIVYVFNIMTVDLFFGVAVCEGNVGDGAEQVPAPAPQVPEPAPQVPAVVEQLPEQTPTNLYSLSEMPLSEFISRADTIVYDEGVPSISTNSTPVDSTDLRPAHPMRDFV